MYVYYGNAILMLAKKNKSDKEMIQDFPELTEYLKICGINSELHFMDNEESTALKWQW